MNLQEALNRIGEIRARLEAAEQFHGFRSLPVACTGLFALFGASVQPLLVANPSSHLGTYVALWGGIALSSVGLMALAVLARIRQQPTLAAKALARSAVAQFVPCCVTGGLLTVLVVLHLPELAWTLPGLWQLLFCQGVFASVRLLPRATFLVGAYYMLSGLATLVVARGELALSPWAMGLPFGIGQFFTAIVLFWTQERGDE